MKEVAITALLTFSVLGGLLSALGILSARTSFDRLHYIGPGVIVMPLPLTVAIVIQNGITAQISVQTLFITAILLATNPVATHAIGRALRVREMHDLRVDATSRAPSRLLFNLWGSFSASLFLLTGSRCRVIRSGRRVTRRAVGRPDDNCEDAWR